MPSKELVLLAFVIWEYIVKVSVKPFNYMFMVEFADKVKSFFEIFLYMFCVFSFFREFQIVYELVMLIII